MIVLLATDGLPEQCSVQSIAGVAQIAANGLTVTPSIETFAIGVFAAADVQAGAPAGLNRIALAGSNNAQGAFNIETSNNDVEAQFLNALTTIRGTKLACQYQLPAPTGAGALDYNEVNVEYRPSTGGTPTTVLYTETVAACDPTAGGWYYDVDPGTGGAPTKVIMCQQPVPRSTARRAGRLTSAWGAQRLRRRP